MLSIKSMHALKVVAHIASAPAFKPVATAKLSRLMDLSVSYLESLLKDLKDGGLVFAHRGPGGGYLLQERIDDLFVWDVVRCFCKSDVYPEQKTISPESNVLFKLKAEIDAIELHFLKNYPLVQITRHIPKNQNFQDFDSLRGRFKPLVKTTLPHAPNSVFDLSNFMHKQAI